MRERGRKPVTSWRMKPDESYNPDQLELPLGIPTIRETREAAATKAVGGRRRYRAQVADFLANQSRLPTAAFTSLPKIKPSAKRMPLRPLVGKETIGYYLPRPFTNRNPKGTTRIQMEGLPEQATWQRTLIHEIGHHMQRVLSPKQFENGPHKEGFATGVEAAFSHPHDVEIHPETGRFIHKGTGEEINAYESEYWDTPMEREQYEDQRRLGFEHGHPTHPEEPDEAPRPTGVHGQLQLPIPGTRTGRYPR